MTATVRTLTEDWGSSEAVDLYLGRCQVDTPEWLVENVWELIHSRRQHVPTVVDFGAGDGRFSRAGNYKKYIGYEIDTTRGGNQQSLPPGAVIQYECAFANCPVEADLCIGNPPYVRNQDLPRGWREKAAGVIRGRIGVEISGLANAWQYFAFLALSSTRADGLVALVLPYEWVSRPAARALREYIEGNGWDVSVYRLNDDAFPRVLTTSSITLIDKRNPSANWRYYEQCTNGEFVQLDSPSGGSSGVIAYSRNSIIKKAALTVKRGLSPGSQRVFALTEAERLRYGLHVDEDVVPCVTTLRPVSTECKVLSDAVFRKRYRDAGERCWLIRPDNNPSAQLQAYLDTVPVEARSTQTCLSRDEWWRFTMPRPPRVLIATGFRERRPKAVVNGVSAVAVGVVAGAAGMTSPAARALVRGFHAANFDDQVVSHSHGFRKLEIGQLKTVVLSLLEEHSTT